MFDREITEGVLSMTCGKFSNFKEPLCLAGGNCNIVGVDINGEDKFWTVLGGNTICMALGDFNSDDKNELFVGTDDFTIRIYKDEEPILEINENTKIVIIAPIDEQYFCYGLETGTIGLYNGSTKVWTKKEKGYCNSIEIRYFTNDEDTLEALMKILKKMKMMKMKKKIKIKLYALPKMGMFMGIVMEKKILFL